MRIEFDSSLETGDHMVDTQHRKLIGMFNDLYSASVEGRGDEAIRGTLDALSAYVDEHFSDEQSLMLRKHYPADKLIAHQAEHHELAEKTRNLVAQHEAGGFMTVLPLATLLGQWLADHIRKSDQEFAAFARAADA